MTTSKDGGNTSGRQLLPDNVKPVHYDVTITPNFDTFEFTGTLAVKLNVLQTTRSIIANAKEVNVKSCLIVSGQTKQAATISHQKEAETVTFTFEDDVTAGQEVVLTADFIGYHNDKMAGFYRSKYTEQEGKEKYMVVTHLEPTSCRRVFPCWDEPKLKATFNFTLNVSPELTALSNMNVTSESETIINGSQLKSVKFAQTPVMSTYLIALAVGDFEYVEAVSKPRKPEGAHQILCRSYAVRGQAEYGRFALDVAVKSLEYYSEFFDVAYPLPKVLSM
jgi:aminopeptidase 2